MSADVCLAPALDQDAGSRAERTAGDLGADARPGQPTWSLASADAVEWLRSLPAGSVDLLITDPAYESLEKHRARGTTTRLKKSKASSNEWFPIFPNARFADLFAEAYRVLAKNAHLYVFCDHETAFIAKPIGEAAGFKFWKPLVFDKERIGMGYHYRARYEFILFFEKGKRRLHDLGIADVIRCQRVVGGYPTEKPVAVSEVLVQQSSDPGQVVVDPFSGSGSTGVAALKLGRSFAGCDVSEHAIALGSNRLRATGARQVERVVSSLRAPEKQLSLFGAEACR